jgi:hypothetical protein
MLIYAGIDESGYGPMFGPFVVARTVFQLADHDHDSLPCLWRLLKKAVCRKYTDRRRRIAIDDSKSLYTPALGLKHLERAVLPFLQLAGHQPRQVTELLDAVGIDPASRMPDQLWYASHLGPADLPVALEEAQIRIAHARLQRCLAGEKVHPLELAAAVVYEDRFNQIVRATRSKARCGWTFVAGHLCSIWQAHGLSHPLVVVDRQGGRDYYRELLQMTFEHADVTITAESPLSSEYLLSEGDRRMTVRFVVDAERQHLPVALASMTAKYTREVLMARFNEFFRRHNPDLRPTAGYFGDGKRFLDEIKPIIVKLGIDSKTLVRYR